MTEEEVYRLELLATEEEHQRQPTWFEVLGLICLYRNTQKSLHALIRDYKDVEDNAQTRKVHG